MISNVTNDTDSMKGSDVKFGIAIFRYTLCTVSMVLNSLEVVTFMSKELRNRSGIMLGVVNLCNLLVTIFEVFNHALRPRSFSVVLELGLQFCMSVTMAVWTAVMVWLSVERYLGICKPWWLLVRNKSSDKAVIAGITIGALCFIFVVHGAFGKATNDQDIVDACIWIWLICYCLFPAGILLFCVIFMAKELRRTPTITKHGNSKSKNATRIVITVCALFIAFNSFPRAAILIMALCRVKDYTLYITVGVFEILSFASLDTFAYLAYHRAYRKRVLGIVTCRTCGERKGLLGTKTMRLTTSDDRTYHYSSIQAIANVTDI